MIFQFHAKFVRFLKSKDTKETLSVPRYIEADILKSMIEGDNNNSNDFDDEDDDSDNNEDEQFDDDGNNHIDKEFRLSYGGNVYKKLKRQLRKIHKISGYLDA